LASAIFWLTPLRIAAVTWSGFRGIEDSSSTHKITHVSPGLYGGFGINATGVGSSPGKGNQSTANATNPAFGYGESLLWVPGWTFLGASYAASIVQGEYFGLGASSVNPPFAISGIAGSELANTNFIVRLSATAGSPL
jgi:hypothetical protein